ncbi:polyheme membrane-associated cytochrome C [Salinarimonas sp. NSM]|uniref:polyheme membrane-associated cytochrome C n=1 Tax=Salinarimonas sp. NSM TaxID=3458003 RepID=UPI0040355CB2
MGTAWVWNGRLAMLALLALIVAPWQAQAQGGAGSSELDRLAAIVERWLASPHGDYHSGSFTHWNAEGEVPVACAACHSQPGFVDFIGADGSAAGAVDAPAAINAPIGCASCHTQAAHALDAVTFPSGVVIDALDASATCTVCHQGRQSGDAVTAATAGLEPDTVSADLSFLNIHYGVAAATMHGSDVRGGFQYPGFSYAQTFEHVPSAATCVACHQPHTTQVATESCFACHQGVDDIRAIRMRHADFDGNGDRSGGIRSEIQGLHAMLYDAIRTYAADVAGAPIVYADGFPYFFADADGDGTIAPEDAIPPNRYASWTPRLLAAAYNYQAVKKDPGGWVHNPAYQIQLLHDSLLSLSDSVPVDTAGLRRP